MDPGIGCDALEPRTSSAVPQPTRPAESGEIGGVTMPNRFATGLARSLVVLIAVAAPATPSSAQMTDRGSRDVLTGDHYRIGNNALSQGAAGAHRASPSERASRRSAANRSEPSTIRSQPGCSVVDRARRPATRSTRRQRVARLSSIGRPRAATSPERTRGFSTAGRASSPSTPRRAPISASTACGTNAAEAAQPQRWRRQSAGSLVRWGSYISIRGFATIRWKIAMTAAKAGKPKANHAR